MTGGDAQSAEKDARQYAHEIVPHPDEGEAKPVAYMARYHYAQAQGWHGAFAEVISVEPGSREPLDGAALDFALSRYLGHAELGFVYDALAQGLSGDRVVQWVALRNHSESAEWVWERAVDLGLDPGAIRPYSAKRKVSTPPVTDGGEHRG